MGLRESKKARTRQHISNLARDLFIERGYADVTVAEIAARAEVAVQTVFNYFPTKESLIFDLEDEIDTDIQSAIRNRKKGQSCLDALHAYFTESKLFNPPEKKVFAGFAKLIRSTPELNAYLRALWGRYEHTLSKEIQNESAISKLEAETIAKLILEGVSHACNSSSSPKDALNFTFKVLKNGWNK